MRWEVASAARHAELLVGAETVDQNDTVGDNTYPAKRVDGNHVNTSPKRIGMGGGWCQVGFITVGQKGIERC